jgi:hypothetical protein
MRQMILVGVGVLVPALLLTSLALADKCLRDSVPVGNVCVDTYEASVWEIPASNRALINKVKKGAATQADLTAGGVQHGTDSDDYGVVCPDTGNGCTTYYAASVPGVIPARFLTWFQAAAACRNAGKRLATNAEWQMAALGTPDPGTDNGGTDCNVGSTFNVAPTGARAYCRSDVGAYDLVGNLWEWVAEWGALTATCTTALFPETDDHNCFAGADPSYGPVALLRGGNFAMGPFAGVFAIAEDSRPSIGGIVGGFRCVR